MKRPSPSDDSAALHEAISAVIKEHGRGGLAMAARELGTTSSALRKRLARPETAFDQITLRACVLVMELRRQAEEQPPSQPPEPAQDKQAQEPEPSP